MSGQEFDLDAARVRVEGMRSGAVSYRANLAAWADLRGAIGRIEGLEAAHDTLTEEIEEWRALTLALEGKLQRALERLRRFAGGHGGHGVRVVTDPAVIPVCASCRRIDGLILHLPDCELAALIRDLEQS